MLSDTEAPPEASTGGDAHHNHNATHTTQPTTRDPQPPTSTSLHVHAVAPNSDTCSTAVFQPDTEAAAKVDAITRAITDQLCDAVEQDDDGRRAGEERAMAAAALRGALGGKVLLVVLIPVQNVLRLDCGVQSSEHTPVLVAVVE